LCVLSDTGGYIFGSKFGKHKISKVISPNKSVEGFVGSLICTVIGSIIYSHYFLQKETFLFAIVFGVISPFIATFGDFCESLIKRDLAVKDMSTMLLGHGGFLDRFDSLLIYAPVFYVIISVHVF
jgi:phosphatidate cytidylyltransferase